MAKRDSKFNVSKDVTNRQYKDIIFDSKMEKDFYQLVCIPALLSGEYKSVKMQVPYVLQEKFEYFGEKIRDIRYVADFVIVDSKNKTIVVDIKGFSTADALIKAKLFKFKFPKIQLKWITRYGGEWVIYEQNEKRKRENRKLKKNKEKSGE